MGLTRAYLKKGWEVIATCRNPEKANDLKGLSGNIEIHSLDVTDFAAVDSLAGELKGRAIDVLINNAGILGSPSFEKGGPAKRWAIWITMGCAILWKSTPSRR